MPSLTVSAVDAADMLGVSVSLIYKRGRQPDESGQCWLIPGRVRIARAGNRLLIPRCDLDALFAEPPALDEAS